MKNKNKLLKKVLIVLLIGLTTILGTTVSASDSADYEGNGSVGFYGEYEFPEEKPVVPKPGEVKPPITQPNTPSRVLPQTGEATLSNISIAMGGTLLMLGSFLVIKRKRGDFL